MNHAVEGLPPEPDGPTFRFVALRYDWAPTLSHVEGAYGEKATARRIVLPAWWIPTHRVGDMIMTIRPMFEKDRAVLAMFMNSPHLRTRCRTLGWEVMDRDEFFARWNEPPAKPEPGSLIGAAPPKRREPKPLRFTSAPRHPTGS